MPRAILAACLLWAAWPAFADGPPAAVLVATPAGPVAPATLVTLDASGSTGDDFLFDTDIDDSLYKVDSGGKLLYFAAPPTPGVYRFRVESFGITNGKVKVSRAKVAVTVGLSPVPPGPPPTPTPTPPVPVPPAPPNPGPTPTPQSVLVPPFTATLVADDAGLTPRAAAILDSTTIGPAVASLGGHYHAVKVGSAEYARRGLAKALTIAGMSPALVVQDARGGLVVAEPMPATEDALVARLRSLLGGR